MRHELTETLTLFENDLLEADIPDESVDLIFADPPFNVGKNYGDHYDDELPLAEYYALTARWLDRCLAWLKPTGTLYWMTIPRHAPFTNYYLWERATFISEVQWRNVSGLNDKRRFRNAYQPIFVYGKTEDYFFELYAEEAKEAVINWNKNRNSRQKRQMKDVWDDIPFIYAGSVVHPEAILKPDSKAKAHPAQMPLALPTRAIRFSCPDGGVVLDPFCGSGTTLVAAEKMKRIGIGIEMSPDNCKLIKERVEDVVSIPTLF